MKFKRLFKPPPEDTEEDTKEYLQNKGFLDLSVDRKRKNKFAAFDQYAKDKAQDKGELQPNEYRPDLNNYPGNPDSEQSEVQEDSFRDPYAQPIANDPYAAYNTSEDYKPKAQSSRREETNNGRANVPYSSRQDPYTSSSKRDPYALSSREDPYASSSRQDLNSAPENYNTSQKIDPYASSRAHTYGNEPTQDLYASSMQSGPYGQGARKGSYAKSQSSLAGHSSAGLKSSRLQKANSEMTKSEPTLDTHQDKSTSQGAYDINSDPYSDVYSEQPPSYREDPYAVQTQSVYAASTRGRDLNEEQVALEEDLNDYPAFHEQAQSQRQGYDNRYSNDYAINQDYLSPEELERQRQQEEEDEAVEGIKGQIRTAKLDTLHSSNNMLAHLNKAREDARNTLGEVGNQGFKLTEIEADLHLAEKQQKVAEQGVKDLAHYNRGLFSVRVANPFNRKSKLRAEEAKFKNERILAKQEAQDRSREWYRAQQNLVDSMENGVSRTKSGVNSPIYQKYERERMLKEAQKYQFEADEEDDELEIGIAKNTDEALKIAQDLKNMSVTMGQEIDRQNKAIEKIGDRADRVDTNLSYDVQRLRRVN